MIAQSSPAAAGAAFSRGKAWTQHREPAATSVTSADFPVWLQEGEVPLSWQCGGATCPSLGMPHLKLPRARGWHGAHAASAAWKAAIVLGPGFILGSDSQPGLFRAPGALALASAGFQVPASVGDLILSKSEQWLGLPSLGVPYCHLQSVTFV